MAQPGRQNTRGPSLGDRERTGGQRAGEVEAACWHPPSVAAYRPPALRSSTVTTSGRRPRWCEPRGPRVAPGPRAWPSPGRGASSPGRDPPWRDRPWRDRPWRDPPWRGPRWRVEPRCRYPAAEAPLRLHSRRWVRQPQTSGFGSHRQRVCRHRPECRRRQAPASRDRGTGCREGHRGRHQALRVEPWCRFVRSEAPLRLQSRMGGQGGLAGKHGVGPTREIRGRRGSAPGSIQ